MITPESHVISFSSFFLVRYEDLVADPLAMSERLYSFMGVTLTDEMREGIKGHSNLSAEEGGRRPPANYKPFAPGGYYR